MLVGVNMDTKRKVKSKQVSAKIDLVDNLDRRATVISEGALRNLLRRFNDSQRCWLVIIGSLSVFLTTIPSIWNTQDPFWQAFFVILALSSGGVSVACFIRLIWDWGHGNHLSEEEIINRLFKRKE